MRMKPKFSPADLAIFALQFTIYNFYVDWRLCSNLCQTRSIPGCHQICLLFVCMGNTTDHSTRISISKKGISLRRQLSSFHCNLIRTKYFFPSYTGLTDCVVKVKAILLFSSRQVNFRCRTKKH